MKTASKFHLESEFILNLDFNLSQYQNEWKGKDKMGNYRFG